MKPHRTRVKICGIRDADTAAHAAACGADFIGFIFVKGSPRFIRPKDAYGVMASLPPGVTAVGVTRDLTVDQFGDIEQECPCVLMQLHGSENDRTVAACGPGVIKAIRFDADTIDAELKRWDAIDECEGVLIDGGDGGTGESLDWEGLASAVEQTKFEKPLFLAGGLTPENVGDAIKAVRPWAVDVSSGVESEPGKKDPTKIAAFCAAVRAADSDRSED